eukprot:1433673-Karenia_brevis.AAC.1
MEAHHRLGRFIITTLWDLSAFYDSIQPASLVTDLMHAGLPVHTAAMSLACHANLRRIRLDGHFGCTVMP